MSKIKTGVIGLGSRGKALLNTLLAIEECEVVAVSDLYGDRMEYAADKIKKATGREPKKYRNYKELIADACVEAVVIISSWDMHVRMAVDSMRRGKFTALEVGGAYDIEDCWELVRAYEETETPFMLLENCCFDRFELLCTSLHRQGKFGKVTYCHGAYAHDLREEILGGNVNRHYRLENYKLRNCENYPTHELGPIAKLLNITRGNKLQTLSSQASMSGVSLGVAAKDGRSPDKTLAGEDFMQGDIVVTTVKTALGELITLRLDTTLPRYYSREFTVRGTKGCAEQSANLILFESDTNMHEFFDPQRSLAKHMNSAEKYKDYLPDEWRLITEEERKLGHGGMDYLEFKAFFDCIINGKEMPIDVYEAATLMAITPLTEQSIATGGMPQAIPDFTRGAWLKRKPLDVLSLPIPEDLSDRSFVNPFGKSRGEGE